MAELHVVEDERPGIKKEIDEGAMDLIFQAIQEDIYSFPIKSFVRESISNGLDAIVERNVAINIINGEPEEKYFLQRTDEKLLKDSGFNEDYYSLNHLGDSSIVSVTYRENHGRDLITIKDQGVGLGGSRLKGFFKLGYSSKRNMKDVIGKFGAGAKAGLATGVEYFVMHTVYNGYKTSFMIFKNDYENITPKQDDSKVEIWTVKMANDSMSTREIYWTPTKEPNGVQIDLEVKSHNKALFLEAVTSQFQYFNGKVKLTTIDTSGMTKTDLLNSKPEYESEALLIPKYSTYSSPHILVDGISYGLISWDELELERRQGKIAIKVHATDVDITQSRESLKWTEKTKKTILNAIEIAKQEAEDHIASKLIIKNPDNLLEINTIYGSLAKGSGENVSSTFSKFLDMHSIRPAVTVNLPNKQVIKAYLSTPFFDFIGNGLSIRRLSLSFSNNKSKVMSTRVESFNELRSATVVYAESSSLGPKLLTHLLNKYEVSSIVYVRPVSSGSFDGAANITYGRYEVQASIVQDYATELFKTYGNLFLDTYDVVYDEKEEDLEKEQVITKETAALIRKANQEVLYTTYNHHMLDFYTQKVDPSWGRGLQVTQEKHTIKISGIEHEFDSENKEELVICTGKYKDLGKIVELCSYVFPENNTRVIYVAQDVVPHFAPYGTVITDYLRTVNPETGQLMIGSQIRNLNTWRMMHDIVYSNGDISTNFEMLDAFSSIDIERYKKVYYKSQNALDPKEMILRSTGTTFTKEVVDDIFGYLDSLLEFQKIVRTADPELISATAMMLFQSPDIYDLDAYDEELIHGIQDEFKRLEPVRPLLAVCDTSGDFNAAKPLIDLLLKTLNTQTDVNI